MSGCRVIFGIDYFGIVMRVFHSLEDRCSCSAVLDSPSAPALYDAVSLYHLQVTESYLCCITKGSDRLLSRFLGHLLGFPDELEYRCAAVY